MGFRNRKQKKHGPDPAELATELSVLDRVLATEAYRGRPLPTFGAPMRCPDCNTYTMVKIESVPVLCARNRCVVCKTEFRVTKRALALVAEAGSAAAAAEAAGVTLESDGDLLAPLPGPTLPTAAPPPPAPSRPVPPAPRPVETPPPPRGAPRPAAPTPAPAAPPAPAAAPERPVTPTEPLSPAPPDVPAAPAAVTPEPAGPEPPIPSRPLTVLLVEDDPADAELLRAVFEPVDGHIRIHHAQTRRDGERLASNPEIDLVLLDLGLPDSAGLTTLTKWTAGRDVPVVVLSGNDNEALAEAATRFGARYFLHKDALSDYLDAGASGAKELVSLLRSSAED